MRNCDLSTSKIEIFAKSEVTPAMMALLKYQFESHCKGKLSVNEGVSPAYVKQTLSKYEYVIMATSKNHMGTRSKSVEKLCGFLFLQKKSKHAYIDIVCSSDRIGWKLLDFAEEWVHENWKADAIFLNALRPVRCMYAFRGYREVPPSKACKLKVVRQPAGNESSGFRMSKCVKNGKRMSTRKLYPLECNPDHNRQLYAEAQD